MHLTNVALRAALVAAPLFLFSAAPVAQPGSAARVSLLQAADGTELKADQTYAAGATVKVPRLGATFKVPAGVSMTYDAGAGIFLLKPSGAERCGVLALRTGLTATEAQQVFGPEVDFTSMHEAAYLERTGEATVNGELVNADYSGDECGGRAQARVSETGASYLLILADASAEKAKAVVDEFHKNFVAGEPSADERKSWLAQVSGQRLKAGSTVVEIRADGSYSLSAQTDEGEFKQAGTWKLELTPFAAALVLTPQGGQVLVASLSLEGKQLLVDGSPFEREPLAGGAKAPDKTETPGPTAEAPKEKPPEAADKGKSRKVNADPNWKTDIKEVAKLDGAELQVGVPYQAAQRLKTDFLGIGFQFPEGMVGGIDPKAPMFLLRPNDQRGVGGIYMQTGINSAASAAAVLHQDQDLSDVEQGVVLKPNGDAKIEGGRITQDYSHEVYTGRSVALIGPSGNGVLFWMVVPKEDRAKMEGTLKAFVDSAQFAKPTAEEKRAGMAQQVGGKCLHVFRYKSVNAGSGNSSSWETNIWYHLGSDGTYFYQYRFVGDHYVKGTDGGGNETGRAGAASQNDRTDAGKWRFEFNLTGLLLMLVSDAGDETEHLVRIENGKVFLNNEEVTVGASDKKK